MSGAYRLGASGWGRVPGYGVPQKAGAGLCSELRAIAKGSRGSEIPTANCSLAWGVPPAAAVQQLVARGGPSETQMRSTAGSATTGALKRCTIVEAVLHENSMPSGSSDEAGQPLNNRQKTQRSSLLCQFGIRLAILRLSSALAPSWMGFQGSGHDRHPYDGSEFLFGHVARFGDILPAEQREAQFA